MKCPFCGASNQPGDDFCANCGGYLKAQAGAGAATIVAPTSNSGPVTTGGGGAVQRTLLPNDRLEHGRYVVEKILGQGGMGAAVLAKDTRLSSKLVVIKELVSDSSDPTKFQEDVRNFQLEVETLASLEHPLIPSVRDSFQEGRRYFMVQDYASGENLEERIERLNQPLQEQVVLLYATQVLDILDYLEQQNPPIVHRDIKPANIIVGAKDNRARLVDFGIARAQANKNAKRKQTSALGTPGYAPPEQYQGNADGRSDMYALAATMHHLLTNRDPRDHAPFVYPLVRSVNQKISPETERVLERALKINPNERYQNAAAMRHDIEEILNRRFSSAGDTSSYLKTSGSMTMPAVPPSRTAPTQMAAASNAQRRPSVANQQQMQQQQQSVSNVTPMPTRKSNVRRNFLLLVVVVVLIGGVLLLPQILSSRKPGGTGGSGSQPTSAPPSNPISVRQVGNETIGISDGSFAFDTNRADGDLKKRAAEAYQKGDVSSAMSLMRSAVAQDSSDAEALIYLQNYQLRLSNAKYVTFVVGTMPSGNEAIVNVARDNLQGAYVAQKEFNDSGKLPNGLKVRLLVASSGGKQDNVKAVAQQITQLKSDKTFKGVMGWPYSSLTYGAVPILSQAQVPMVSPTASDDGLTNISPYFFRVAATNKAEAIAGAKYAKSEMKAQNVVVFTDPADPYSQSLGDAFSAEFKNEGGNILDTRNYKVGQADSVTSNVQPTLQKNPDLIYFAGHASDVNPLLAALDSAGAPATLKVLGGDGLYESGGVGGAARARLAFTAFAYPDTWDILGLGAKKPAFFNDYTAAFSNGKKGYGFNRATADTQLSYDAMYTLLNAYSKVASKDNATADDLKNALLQMPFQGVSGWIQLGNNGDPVDKAVVVLSVNAKGENQFVKVLNKFTN